jgi:hypothetical protein
MQTLNPAGELSRKITEVVSGESKARSFCQRVYEPCPEPKVLAIIHQKAEFGVSAQNEAYVRFLAGWIRAATIIDKPQT